VKSPSNLFNVPSEYHKFANVFSKSKTEVFTPHYSYNLKINLEEDVQPPVGTIYSLLASEQETLKEFIKKNLNTDFIKPTSFLYNILDVCVVIYLDDTHLL